MTSGLQVEVAFGFTDAQKSHGTNEMPHFYKLNSNHDLSP